MTPLELCSKHQVPQGKMKRCGQDGIRIKLSWQTTVVERYTADYFYEYPINQNGFEIQIGI